MPTLVIVESPAKAKKISTYLGKNYIVEASLGHVRDLPGSKAEIPEKYAREKWASLGVNPETFRPIYVVPDSKVRTVRNLQALMQKADKVLFAADPDREGEAIAWHLSQLLGVQEPVRLVYTEITRDALQAALANTRPINYALVAAQESRRVIDRLVGYSVSPLLWSSVGGKLSAGRVQSATLNLLVDRELARMRFKPATFWSIRADVGTKPKFTATATHVRSKNRPGGQAIAKASDFTQDGVLKDGADVLVMNDEQAQALSAYLNGKDATVTAVDLSESRSRPAPPFTTSTLQQAAGRLKLSAKQVMDVAQKLYESGFITYMRTDSPSLSDEALDAARQEAKRLFGPDAVPHSARQYATRNKNAQEAHEAIRPTGTSWRPPERTGLAGDQLDVYTLVYQRTVASQMHDAVYDKTVVTLECGAATLRAQGRVLRQAGYTQLLAADEDDDQADQKLPRIEVGQQVPLTSRPPEGKKTSAPPRFTEATLVHAMEKAGIGRPSTYAQTLATLQARDYVRPVGRQLAASAVGLLVATYLAQSVPDVTRADFTATMEAGLDDVASGLVTRVDYLTRFWTHGLAPMIRLAGDDFPSLLLPHLDDVRLRATPSGPKLWHAGKSAALPVEAIPADLSAADVQAIMQGTWKPRKARAGKARDEQPTKASKSKAPGKLQASKGAKSTRATTS